MLKKQIAPFLVIKLYHTLAYSFGSEDISFELFHRVNGPNVLSRGEAKEMSVASAILFVTCLQPSLVDLTFVCSNSVFDRLQSVSISK